MPVEDIILEIRKQDRIIDEAQKAKRILFEELETADEEWISAKKAASLLSVSIGVIYNKINSGELETKNIGSTKRVRKSQVLAINDK